MPNIAAMRQKYFVQEADVNPPTESMPPTFEGCHVTYLIDAEKYFNEVLSALDRVGTRSPDENAEDFVLIAGWWLDLLGVSVQPPQPLYLDGPAATKKLSALLKQKARDGVDVRVLGFVNPEIMTVTSRYPISHLMGFRNDYLSTIMAIEDLRSEPKLSKKCCLNIIGHTAGGVHTKLVVIGNSNEALGFTGGIDFRFDRYDTESHPPGLHQRHDVVTKVSGPAVQAFYDFFRDMWNEIVASPSKRVRIGPAWWGPEPGPTTTTWLYSAVPGTDALPDRTLSSARIGEHNHHVQSLVTLPAARYGSFNLFAARQPLSFAPDGLFTAHLAWRKAILAAEKYIYMEDWAFWSKEVMEWFKDSIVNHAQLKVLLVKGFDDPNDPPDVREQPWMEEALLQFGDLSPPEAGRIRVLRRRDVHVHSKTTLIDDHWAIIGSTTCTRRSLYTDIEHSVAIMDEKDELIKAYRVDLWGHHFTPSGSLIDDLDRALSVWWGATINGVRLRDDFSAIALPSESPLSPKSIRQYDKMFDVDSRNVWAITPRDVWEIYQ